MSDNEMFKRLRLSDGTILENCECGCSDNYIWCYLNDISFREAFLLFSDLNKINTISFEYGFEDRYTRITYTGANDIKSIEKRVNSIDVCLVGNDIVANTEKIHNTPVSEGGDT